VLDTLLFFNALDALDTLNALDALDTNALLLTYISSRTLTELFFELIKGVLGPLA
jgi:prenyltransferase beta subunit